MSARMLSAAVAATVVFIHGTAHAEDEPVVYDDAGGHAGESKSAEPSLGLHLQPVVTGPIGHMGDSTGPGIGALVGLSYRLSDDWQLVGRTGYVVGTDTGSDLPGIASVHSSISYAPFLFGAKAFVFKGEPMVPVRIYVRGEIGPLLVNSSAQADAGSMSASTSDSSVRFGAAFSAGLDSFGGVIDMGMGFLIADLGNVDQSTALIGNVGFRFAQF